MRTVFRGVLALMLGFMAAFFVVLVGETAGHFIFPPPPGVNFDMNDPESLAELMKSLPIGALISVMAAWGLAAFAGGWVTSRFAPGRKIAFGLGLGVLFLLVTLGNLLMIPHPTWMWVVGLGEVLPAAYLGAWLASPRKAQAMADL